MSDKRIYELLNSNTLSAGDKLAIDKNSFSEAKSIDASLILTPISDLESEKVPKSDLTNISITGTKNNTGSTITSGTFFYKDGTLVKAKTDIANNATLTLNTNYEIVTAGGLNALNEALSLLNHTTNDTIIGKDENGKDIHRKIYTGTSFTNGMVIDANLKKANLDWVSIESFTYSISTTMYGNQTDTGENTRYLASVMFNSSGMVAMNSNIAVTKYRIVVHYVLA